MSYQKFNTYGKLKKVILGSFYEPEFFSKIHDNRIRDPLMKIAEEINQDLNYFEKILKQHGSEVLRPKIDKRYLDIDNAYLPPLQVRNNFCVIGKDMYQLLPDFKDSIVDDLDAVIDLVNDNESFYTQSMLLAKHNFNPQSGTLYSKEKYTQLAGNDWPNYQDYVSGSFIANKKIQFEMSKYRQVLEYESKELGPLQAPNVINTDECIYVDSNEYCNYKDWLQSRIDDTRPVVQFTSGAGHVDGCFAVLGKKVILGIDPLIDYSTIFPGYSVVKVPELSYQNYIEEFKIMKNKVGGAWWIVGQEHNDNLIQFIENHLKSWTGFVQESIFDVNVLALDENTICVSNITSELESKLKKLGIECVVVPWRHRFFVDGGLHCITLDLYRDQ
jgi:hypothetical protein